MDINNNIELIDSLPVVKNQQIINAFLLEANKKNKSIITIKDYRKHLLYFFKSITIPIDLIQSVDIKESIAMKEEKYNIPTITKYISVLRVFFRFCVEEEYINQSPVEQLDREKEIPRNYWEVQKQLPNIENQQIVNEFLLNMKDQNIEQEKISSYRRSLTVFFRDWEKPFTSITLEEIQKWFKEGKREETSLYIHALRSFYTYSEEKGYVVNPPVRKERWDRTTTNEWEIDRPIKNKENLVLIQQYLFSLKEKNTSIGTIRGYRTILQIFFKDRNESFALITIAEIEQWIHELLKVISKKTIEQYLSVIRHFYRFCMNKGLIDESPVRYMWERENNQGCYWELKNPLRNAQNHQVINEYLLCSKLANLSKRTVESKRHILERFFKSLEDSYAQLPQEYFLQCISEWKETLREGTILNILSTLSSFYNYCVGEEYIETSPIKSRWMPRKPKSVPKFLEKEQVAKIRVYSEKLTLRDLVIVEFLFATGCRIGELHQLNRADVDIENRTAIVLGKGKKFRTVHFSERCALLLRKYLEMREDTHPALIVAARETRLGIQRMQKIISEIGKQLNLEGSLHAHRFRHTFATNLLAKGADLAFIADELGHSNLQTTQIYARLPKQELIIMYRKYMG